MDKFGLIASLQKAYKTGEPVHLPASYYKDKHRQGWRDNHIYRLPSGDIVAIYDDVTDTIEAQNSLKESEEKFRTLFESSPEQIILIGIDGVIKEVNQKTVEDYGLEKEDFVGKHFSELGVLREEDLPQHAEIFQKIIEGERVEPVEVSVVSEKGRRKWSLAYPAAIMKNDTIDGFIFVAVDITERKKAEEELIQQKELLQTILDGIPDVVSLKKPDLEVISYNKVGYELLGKAAQEIVGTKCYEIIGRKTECSDCATSMAISSGDIETIERYEKAFDIWLEARAIPIKDSSGNIKMTVELLRDITKQRQDQEEKEALQKQLLQAQKMEAIGILAGGVAHDFNNLLGIIMGSAQLAKYDVQENGEADKELQVIVDAAKRAKDLTSKLLTFARKDSGKKSVNSIPRILEDAVMILNRSISKSIKVRNLWEEDILVECDANQIYQAVMNLCTNAADSMPSGGDLILECRETDSFEDNCKTCGKEFEGKYCLIQVSDTGVGIPEEHLSRITEPFYTTKGVGKGTGLGLSVTHGIVTAHDGHLHIYSEYHKGTCVKMYLPIKEIRTPEADEETKRISMTGNETVLVIDDEKQLLEMAGRILTKKGYKPVLASGGEEGIEKYKEMEKNISVVVLDLMMPDMDGAEVYGQLKEINPKVKVIFSSGYSINGQAKQLLGEGQLTFVQKPFDIEGLCEAIRNLIDKGKS